MRLIDADELVFDYSGLVYIDPYDIEGIVKYFAKQIARMPTIEPEPHWTPCSEHLPNKEGIYIVTDDAGGMATVSTDEFSHYEDGEPMWLFSQNVTAWMPLPEPYKEEKDEDKKDVYFN